MLMVIIYKNYTEKAFLNRTIYWPTVFISAATL